MSLHFLPQKATQLQFGHPIGAFSLKISRIFIRSIERKMELAVRVNYANRRIKTECKKTFRARKRRDSIQISLKSIDQQFYDNICIHGSSKQVLCKTESKVRVKENYLRENI